MALQHRVATHRTGWRPILPIIIALLYGASPIDLIPDVILLIGWTDDLVVISLLMLLGAARWLRGRKRAGV